MQEFRFQNKFEFQNNNKIVKSFVICALCFVIILSFVLCDLTLAVSEDMPKYISLAPSTTEILFALGLDKEIIGVSSYCDYPPEAGKKEKIGTFSSPSIEKIISMKPDFIFCTGLEQDGAVTQLKELKMNLYIADPQNIKELLDSIREIGRLTAKEKEAENLINNIQKDIDEVSKKISGIPMLKRKRLFIEIWHEPLMTAAKGSFIDEMVTLAGGVNIADNTRRPFTIFSAEEAVKSDPDCIILAYMDKASALSFISRRAGWQKIKAVRNKRVFNDINPDIILRPGPRVGTAIREIHKRLYSCEN